MTLDDITATEKKLQQIEYERRIREVCLYLLRCEFMCDMNHVGISWPIIEKMPDDSMCMYKHYLFAFVHSPPFIRFNYSW